MRDNISLLRVLREDGNFTGVCLTEVEVHGGHHWHSCVCVCVTDGRGNIYVSERGFGTAIAPGKFDMFLAADHIVDEDYAPQEAVERALLRRIGLRRPVTEKSVYEAKSVYWVPDNTFPLRSGYQGYWHRAFEYIYVIREPGLMTQPEISLKLQEGRIQDIRLCSMNQVAAEYRARPDSMAYQQYMHRPPNEENILDAVYHAVMELQY